MVIVKKASIAHADGIAKVCTDGYWATYKEMYDNSHIERIIKEFYNRDRILNEIENTGKEWGGWFVALDNEVVVGAGGGGMTGPSTGELFVLYLDPNRRNEGIGTLILDAVTQQQKALGATEQWVSVAKGNMKGIPFYEARGFVFQFEKPSYGNTEGEHYISLRYKRWI
ncbi:MAG: GNAT family N-acetyltransferase [Tuberibacillus sp.]